MQKKKSEDKLQRRQAKLRRLTKLKIAAAPPPPLTCTTGHFLEPAGRSIPSHALKTYVLHVAGAKQRWVQTLAQLAIGGIDDYETIDAVLEGSADVERRQWNISGNGGAARNAAVALSHMRALRAIAHGAHERALVLEDDVLLAPRMKERTLQLLAAISPASYELLFLGWYHHLTQPSCVCPVVGHLSLRALVGDGVRAQRWWGAGGCINTGMNAYVASRAGARRVLRVLATLTDTIDVQLGLAAQANHQAWGGDGRGRAMQPRPRAVRLLAVWPPDGEEALATHNWSAKSIRVEGEVAF